MREYAPFGYRRVETWDAKVRVAGRRAVALHADKPRRRGEGRDREGVFEVVREISRLLLLELRLELLAFVIPAEKTLSASPTIRRLDDVQLSVLGHLGLGLKLEEGIVQLLVVDVDLSHLRLNALARLGFERLPLLLLLDRVSLRCDAGIGDEACRSER